MGGSPGTVAVQVRYSVDPGTNPPHRVGSVADWRRPMPDGTERRLSALQVFEAGSGREKKLWLGDGVDRVTVRVHGAARVRIEQVRVFVPQQ